MVLKNLKVFVGRRVYKRTQKAYALYNIGMRCYGDGWSSCIHTLIVSFEAILERVWSIVYNITQTTYREKRMQHRYVLLRSRIAAAAAGIQQNKITQVCIAPLSIYLTDGPPPRPPTTIAIASFIVSITENVPFRPVRHGTRCQATEASNDVNRRPVLAGSRCIFIYWSTRSICDNVPFYTCHHRSPGNSNW